MVFEKLRKIKDESVHLNYGREIIAGWFAEYVRSHGRMDILDIGVGQGRDIVKLKEHAPEGCEFFGVDYYEPNVLESRSKGISVIQMDIEHDALPFPEHRFDVVVANQVLEHTKEVFWIVSEVCRVLKKGGMFIVGVPNLASLHNRLRLLVGRQPTSIKILSEHVRGFTTSAMVEFLTEGGFLRLKDFKGSNFYPFREQTAGYLARLFPQSAVGIFFLLERTEKTGCFGERMKDRFFETKFRVEKSENSQD